MQILDLPRRSTYPRLEIGRLILRQLPRPLLADGNWLDTPIPPKNKNGAIGIAPSRSRFLDP